MNHGLIGWSQSQLLDRTGKRVQKPIWDKGGQVYNVKTYGAIGNGTADDTAALEACIAAAGVGGTVLWPHGSNFKTTSEVDLNVAGQRHVAYGAKITKVATFTGSAVVRVAAVNVTIEGLEIDGTDKADDGIILSSAVASGFSCKGCKIYNCLYGISANNNDEVLLEGNDISLTANYSIRAHNITGAAANFGIKILSNRLDMSDHVAATSTAGCLLVRGDETFPHTDVIVSGNTMLHVSDPTNSAALGCELRFIDGGVFSSNTARGGAMLVSVAASKNIAVVGNSAIGQTFYAIEIASTSSSPCLNISVAGNTIRGDGLLNYGVGLQGTVSGCRRAAITNNTISGVVLYGIYSNDEWQDIAISGNNISISDTGSTQYGIYLQGTATRQINQVAITGNQLHGNSAGEKAIYLRNVSNATVAGNSCFGWTETSLLLHVDSTVTIDDIAITGNTLTPVGGSAITKTVSGTMGSRVVAKGNSGFVLSGAVNTDILNYNLGVYESWGTGSPEASVTSAASSIYHRTDGGVGSVLYVKDQGSGNTGWLASGGPYVLAQSAVAASHTGDLNETTLATVTIPAGAMGTNGRVRITSLWSHTNSANNKIMRIRFGGTGGTQYMSQTNTTSASFHDLRQIANRNSASSQVGFPSGGGTGGWGSTTNAVTTSSVNTASATDIVFRALLANTGETITLESYCVELLPG